MLGLGLTGFSLARHLVAHGATVRVADTRATPPFAAKLAAALPGVKVAAGPFAAHTFAGADLVVLCTPMSTYAGIGANARIGQGTGSVGAITIQSSSRIAAYRPCA